MRVGPALCPWLDHIIDPYKLMHRQLYVFDTYTNFICTLLQKRFVGTAHLFIRGGSKFNSFLQKSGSTVAVHPPQKMHQGGWPITRVTRPRKNKKSVGGGTSSYYRTTATHIPLSHPYLFDFSTAGAAAAPSSGGRSYERRVRRWRIRGGSGQLAVTGGPVFFCFLSWFLGAGDPLTHPYKSISKGGYVIRPYK